MIYQMFKQRVNQLQSPDPSLPSAPDQKWTVGTIIATMFEASGKLKDVFLGILDAGWKLDNSYLNILDAGWKLDNSYLNIQVDWGNKVSNSSLNVFNGLTSNTLPRFLNTNFVNSVITDNGTNVGISVTNPYKKTWCGVRY